ncbi:CidA/LrgA family holin-like protein [Bacillus mycoides]|uniref:CidA/LrgA family holin-like protein n=1 Tax=Bacillus mycoides TaxID=1405 RepID=UPI003D010D3C
MMNMKLTKILVQIAALYVLYMVGNWVQEMLNLPIPGSLIGMFLLLVLLSLKVLPVKWFDLGAETLVAIMPFLLIPPTLGLMNYGAFFMSKGISLFITVVASTFLIIIVAGHTGQYLANRKEKETQ